MVSGMTLRFLSSFYDYSLDDLLQSPNYQSGYTPWTLNAWISREITVQSPDYDGHLPTTPLTPPKLPLSQIHSTPTIPWGNANFILPIPYPIHQQILSTSPLHQFYLSQPNTTSCSGSCNRLQTVFSASLAPPLSWDQ